MARTAAMPKDVETAAVETETGFGTGLLEHLKARQVRSEAATEQPDPASEAPERDPGASQLTDQEEALLELERELAGRAEALQAREAEVAARQEQVEAEVAARLAEVEAEVAERLAHVEAEAARLAELRTEPASQEEQAAPVVSAREYLRRRVESEGERIWSAFSSALEATKGNGAPDFRTRLLAATALLAEVYGEHDRPVAPIDLPAAAELQDELADLRARRARTRR
jgi:hypothetical protein